MSTYQSHVIGQNTSIAFELFETHDTLVHELYSFPLMWTQPFGQDGRNKYIILGIHGEGGRFATLDRHFNTIFIRHDFFHTVPKKEVNAGV